MGPSPDPLIDVIAAWPAAALRFELPSSSAPAAIDAPALAALPRSSVVHSRCTLEYWDSAELDLMRAGVTLRLQREHDLCWQQLADSSRAWAHESSCPGGRPALAPAIEAGWHLARPLREIEPKLACAFSATITRAASTVRLPDATVARVTHERYRLRAGRRGTEHRAALHLELHTGDIRRLHELAHRIVGEIQGCRLTSCTERDWGFALVAGVRVPAHRAQPLEVKRKARATPFALAALREALTHTARNIDGAFDGVDPEYVHQMRVGMRRLRVADRIARHADLPAFSPRFRKELDWMWDILGEARDSDVFAAETWPRLQTALAASVEDTSEAMLSIHALRDRARQQVRAALGSVRFQRIIVTAAWILAQQEAWAKLSPNDIQARHLARKLLDRTHRRVLEQGARLAHLTPGERHALRREAKKLRYLAAFAAPMFGRSRTRAFIARLEDVQSVLGTLNDCAVAASLAGKAVAELRASLGAVIGAGVRQGASALEDTASAQLRRAWRRFEKAKPFWHPRAKAAKP